MIRHRYSSRGSGLVHSPALFVLFFLAGFNGLECVLNFNASVKEACHHPASRWGGNAMDQQIILSERRAGYHVITLNRPQRLNTFCEPMHYALRQAIAAADG